MTELRFLGFGAAFAPELGNTSAWFRAGAAFYLLDCGGDVFHKVVKLNAYHTADHIYVIVTHMHTDHVGSLGDLIAYSWFVKHKKVWLYYPDERLKSYLGLCGIMEDYYTWMKRFPDHGDVKIQPVSVFHDPSMGCFGYRISVGSETIYYSGDSKTVEDHILYELTQGTLSHLYLDTSTTAAPESGHGNYEALKSKVPVAFRKNITCMHLDCDFRSDIAREGFQLPLID